METGDKVIVLVHGAGVTSKETHIIYEIDNESLKVEEMNAIFYKNNKGNYKTERSMFGFCFEIKGVE